MIGPIKLYRALRAVVRLTLDPTQLDEVFVLADLSEESKKLEAILEAARGDAHFARVLDERPRIGALDQRALEALSPDTVGGAYVAFMRARGHRHEDLVLVDGESDMDFLRNHLRESHDLWHVVTGFDTDVAGELGLQAFYLAQFGGPLPALLIGVGMLNTFLKGMDDAEHRVGAIARGFLLGRRAAPLFGLRWTERFDQSLDAFRAEMGLALDEVDAIVAARGPDAALAEAA